MISSVESNRVDKLSKSLSSASVAWAKFINDYKTSSKNSCFCFFEGEDYKYYTPVIRNIDSDISIYSYSCGGKMEVIEIHKKVSNGEKNTNKLLFFVDKDYDLIEYDYSDFFKTEVYSIENYYTSLTSVSRFIKDEFGINEHEDDYKKLYNLYEEALTVISELLEVINSWYYFINSKKIKVDLKVINRLIEDKLVFNLLSVKLINPDSLNIRLINDHYCTVIKGKLDSTPTSDELNNLMDECSKAMMIITDYSGKFTFENNSRGKFEVITLRKYLKNIKKINKPNCIMNLST